MRIKKLNTWWDDMPWAGWNGMRCGVVLNYCCGRRLDSNLLTEATKLGVAGMIMNDNIRQIYYCEQMRINCEMSANFEVTHWHFTNVFDVQHIWIWLAGNFCKVYEMSNIGNNIYLVRWHTRVERWMFIGAWHLLLSHSFFYSFEGWQRLHSEYPCSVSCWMLFLFSLSSSAWFK